MKIRKLPFISMLILNAIVPPTLLAYAAYGVAGWIGAYIAMFLLAMMAGRPRLLEDGTELQGLFFKADE